MKILEEPSISNAMMTACQSKDLDTRSSNPGAHLPVWSENKHCLVPLPHGSMGYEKDVRHRGKRGGDGGQMLEEKPRTLRTTHKAIELEGPFVP